jgi:hypothetical protein
MDPEWLIVEISPSLHICIMLFRLTPCHSTTLKLHCTLYCMCCFAFKICHYNNIFVSQNDLLWNINRNNYIYNQCFTIQMKLKLNYKPLSDNIIKITALQCSMPFLFYKIIMICFCVFLIFFFASTLRQIVGSSMHGFVY